MKTGIVTDVTVLFGLFGITAASCAHGTSLLKRQLTERAESDGAVKTVAVSTFGYIGEIGP